MELLIEFGKIVLPAAAVIYAMYLTVKMFIQRDWESKRLELSYKNKETVLPLRLQAYERLCLFLERITPNNLIVRLNDSSYNSAQFQHILLKEVRDEFNHNLSQQVYMSDEAWTMVKRAMENLVVIINQASGEVDAESKSIELARKIFDVVMAQETDLIQQALVFLKNEIRQEF